MSIPPANHDVPQWAEMCLASPQDGVIRFLEALGAITGAQYSHIRVLSRLRRHYQMVESIGPYKTIGWQRRFRLLDGKDPTALAYQLISYNDTYDCKSLERKYASDSDAYRYLSSLRYGLWIPLYSGGIELGYATVSWNDKPTDATVVDKLRDYMLSAAPYVSLLFSACRSVLATRQLNQLWNSCHTILSAPEENHCYERIASACTQLWGTDCTAYVGKPSDANTHVEVVAVEGGHAREAQQQRSKTIIPWGTGLFGFALSELVPVRTDSFPTDGRFSYHTMLPSSQVRGSGIAVALRAESKSKPLGVVSVEHDRETYFDNDDLRYLVGLASVAQSAISAHRTAALTLSREMDTLFTQMAHDVFEPLQALVADADVLRSEASMTSIADLGTGETTSLVNGLSRRAANILETCIEINEQVRRVLDAGVDGASSRDVSGRANLYRTLRSLLNSWEDRAATRSIELRARFDSLRGIEVQCDEGELRAVLGHVLGNAIKYSFAGKKQIGAGLPRHVLVLGRVVMRMASIEFQNLGVGILKREIGSVTQKFYRGERARKEGRAGTGRGLWSVHNFVTRIRGSLEIESEPLGSGAAPEGPYRTTVKVLLPVAEES